MRINIVLVFAISCLFSCKGDLEDYLASELPETVELGQSEIYFNGELINYEPSILVRETSSKPNVLYAFGKGQGTSSAHAIAFSQVPLGTGDIKLRHEREEPEFGVKTTVNFFHAVDLDSDGYEYKNINIEDGFLQIDVFDLEERVVQGRFRACFKRTSKNGVKEEDLPKYIVVEGVFYEPFS